MSEQAPGIDWWKAADGKWYPPPRPGLPNLSAPTPIQPVLTFGKVFGAVFLALCLWSVLVALAVAVLSYTPTTN